MSTNYTLLLRTLTIAEPRLKAHRPTASVGVSTRRYWMSFWRIAFRKKIYNTLDKLQVDLDTWMTEYSQERFYSGKYCFAKTPMQPFLDSMRLVKQKTLNKNVQTEDTVWQVKSLS